MSGATGQVALVMFDLDGTLVATAGEIRDAVNDTLVPAGLNEVSLAQVERWIGHGTRALLAQAVASSTQQPAGDRFETLAAQFAGNYQRRCGTTSQLYPHVIEVLTHLRACAIKLAVVTNKESAFTRPLLEHHRLRALLDDVICGDSGPAKKPDPAGLLACMARWHVAAAQALFVGDSGIDVAAARKAGVPVWGVDCGYNMGRPIAAERPDRLLADLRPLLELAGPAHD